MTYKFLDPTSSKFVVIVLVRAGMVYGNKFLWEPLIFKKLWAIAQEENWNKQKRNWEKIKLEQMQKPTSVQLDEKVDELVTEKMDSTIPKEGRNILVGSIKHDAFKSIPKKYPKSHITMKPNMVVNMASKAGGGITKNTVTKLLPIQTHLQ